MTEPSYCSIKRRGSRLGTFVPPIVTGGLPVVTDCHLDSARFPRYLNLKGCAPPP
ncbi:MAG: hypothetical protein HYZ49_20115 [Chloroflexi bacterium]|nr:hypothetical protein [Chloroflexota bacterium]